MRLITKAEYDKLTPRQQGYIQYMQGEWPGSKLKYCHNSYPEGSAEYLSFIAGQMDGVWHSYGVRALRNP